MENRVKAAEDSVQRLTSQLAREREVFNAAVAANTAQSRRLHNLLSSSGAADVSTETHLRRRNEDLQERVKRLIAANRTLRARIKLEELDPDTLVLVAEGFGSSKRNVPEGASGRNSPHVSWDVVGRSSRGHLQTEGAVFSAAPARKRLRGRLRVLDDDSDSESDSGGPSASSDTRPPQRRKTAARPDSTPVASNPARGGVPASSSVDPCAEPLASRLDGRRVLDLSGDALQSASLAPPVTAASSGAPDVSAAGGVSPSLLATSLQNAQATLVSQSSRSALSSDESVATIVLSDGEAEVEDQLKAAEVTSSVSSTRPAVSSGSASTVESTISRRGPVLRSKAARLEFRSALLLEALETDDDDVLGLIDFSPLGSSAGAQDAAQVVGPAGAPSRGAIGGQVRPSPTTPSRSSTGRRTKPTSRVVATLSSMPGADRGSQRPLLVPAPTGGPPPIVRVSKQVAKWAQHFVSPGFRRPGASKCWTRILNCRLPPPVSAKTRAPCTVATLEAFMDYTSPSHPWQRLRRYLPPQACLFDTTTFDPNCKVSQWAPAPLRVRGYWRAFRGFGSEADAAVGFVLWERDHWIPARAVELYFEVAYRAFKESFDEASRPSLQRPASAEIGLYLWEWCRSDRFPDVDIELMFEPSTTAYSLEPLAWTPRTTDWHSELPALEGKEPWRSGWVDVPSQHHYNTTFVLFVLDPSLDPHEISTSWLQVPPVPSSPDESAPDVSLLPTGSVCSSLPAPASDIQLQLLVQAATADSDGVTEI
ncbi:unnamed protein product [Phytophthora fragariaefolia]|uniref:Unnamed protein product n=1 Tax=Phytophthora fragariaefolia TaxID=1490495 RepID=A0A9W6Y4W5_9STRA|nr:unnamed protein product [Phytophthora fragariaefolia]